MKFFFILILLFSFSLTKAKVVEKIVAIINDSIITETDLSTYRKKIGSGGLVDDALLKLTQPKVLLKDRKKLLNHMIDERILDTEIKRLGMTVTIERVEKEIRTVTKRNGLNRAQLKQALKGRGVKFSDYQDFIRTSLERQALIDREVSSKIKISDEDIANEFMKNAGPGQNNIFEYKLAHILFLDKNRSGKSGKARALEVKKKLDSQTIDFKDAASQYSEDPNFVQGGVLGSFKAGEMAKSMEQGIANVPVGKTSKVIKTPMGYHILKVVKKSLVSNPALKAQRSKIYSKLFGEAFKNHFRKWLDQKRDESFIRIN